MLFTVLNDPLFPCPRTHKLHVRKLGEGFVQRGYHYCEARSLDDLTHLCARDVLYVSNHFSTEPAHRLVGGRLERRLASALARCKATRVLWSFHTLRDGAWLEGLDGRVVHLGEDLYAEAIDKEPVLSAFRRRHGVLPLAYGSPLHPDHSGLVEIERDLDFNFVGHGYKQELTRHCQQRYNSLIRNTPPSINEGLRVNSFRRAQVNLVFHAQANVDKGIVVERFAEALSMGGLIFHDHPRIASRFPGLPSVTQVRTAGDIDQAYERIRALSPQALLALRAQSVAAWRQAGLSYFDQAGAILTAAKGTA